MSGLPGKTVEAEPLACLEHRNCSAGQWTASEDTSTSDTQCLACSNGRFREGELATKAKEVSEAVACIDVHKTCSRGECTETTGTSTRDTQCKLVVSVSSVLRHPRANWSSKRNTCA